MVWDVYHTDGLKGHVKGNIKVLSNYTGFLCMVGNKAGLFSLIAESFHAMAVPDWIEVVSSAGNRVVCQPDRARGACLHVCPRADMVHHGNNHTTIKTTDSHVVVIDTSVMKHLKSGGLQEL